MDRSEWVEERDLREKKALERHADLHRLFVEDRLSFERERKRLIDEMINSVEEEEKRDKLRALQASWDKRMRGAGSKHNRFILAQALFWEHFHEKWLPALNAFNNGLEGI